MSYNNRQQTGDSMAVQSVSLTVVIHTEEQFLLLGHEKDSVSFWSTWGTLVHYKL